MHCAYLRPVRVFLVPVCLNSSGELKDLILHCFNFQLFHAIGRVSDQQNNISTPVFGYFFFKLLNFLFITLSIRLESHSCMCSTGFMVVSLVFKSALTKICISCS